MTSTNVKPSEYNLEDSGRTPTVHPDGKDGLDGGVLEDGDERMNWNVYGHSDVGRARSNNEDSHAWWFPEDQAERRRLGLLLVVADGMGGARAGERASRVAASVIVESYSRSSGDDPPRDLTAAVRAANQAVYAESRADAALAGMGTTLTAVVILDEDLVIAQVGDSRAYLVNGGGIRQLTRDHSLVAELVELGRITPQEAQIHPQRNVVTRAIGVAETVEVEEKRWAGVFRPGATVLLCSDGLHGVVPDEEILTRVSGVGLEQAAHSLIEGANDRGGPDNVTVLLARPDAKGTE